MIEPIKHLSVNWVDGMQISEAHYTAQENYISDSLRDVASCTINQLNYGLLPLNDVDAEYDIFEIYNTATNDVQLNIKKCAAITASGHRIAVKEMSVNINSLSGNINNNIQEAGEQSFFVIITVNPFERIPTGDFDPEETPPRHLFVRPNYQVQLVPAASVNNIHIAGNYLIAGKVHYQNGLINVDPAFIPPCTTVNSHQALLKYYYGFVKNVALLQQYATIIIRKSNHKNQHTVIGKCITQMCETILRQCSNNYFFLRNIVRYMPPVNLINVFASFAHSLYLSINTMQDKEKEETLNYCFEWSNVSPHILLNQLSAVVEINYNHYNNGEYMKAIQLMLTSLHAIWEKLSSLEYIGQHKENIIVKDEAITQVIKENKGWSPFD